MSLSRLLLLFFLLFSPQFFPCESSSAQRHLKVLVYSPSISFSHAQFLGKIADTLAGAGHEVHFLKFSHDLGLAEKNETSKVHRVHLVHPQRAMPKEIELKQTGHVANSFDGRWTFLHAWDHSWNSFLPSTVFSCIEMASHRQLLDRLAAEHFDVGLAELYDLCPLAILHLAGVRVKLAATAVPLYQMAGRHFGIPTFSSFVPNVFVSSMDGLRSSFLGRLLNFWDDLFDWAVMDARTVQCQEPILREMFGPDLPGLKAIVRNASLYFVNSSPLFQMPRPISAKIVHIGGLVSSSGKVPALDGEVLSILDSASGGAVLVSFGSLADTNGMSAVMRDAFLRAFGHFPTVQFLWKLDIGQSNASVALPPSCPPNVHFFPWLPQRAVLGHPNLWAFLSHCGWNSVSEAAEAGVPVLGVPLFADQRYNLLVAKQHGMGLHLDVKELNGPGAEGSLVMRLEEILHNPQFRTNARLVQRKLAWTPFSGRENLIRWVEFAAEFPEMLGDLNLPSEEEMGWFIYYSLDSILFTLSVLAMLSGGTLIAGKLITRRILAFLFSKEGLKVKGQ